MSLMSIIGWTLIGFVAAVIALLIWVRVAPTKAALWHNPKVPVMGPGEYPSDGGFLVQRPLRSDGKYVLERLDKIITETPRTTVVAGSPAEGKITYVTRSKVCGFPDFTTVTLARLPAVGASTLQVYGRLRFGKSDLGVNKARIQGWMAQLDALGGTGRPHP